MAFPLAGFLAGHPLLAWFPGRAARLAWVLYVRHLGVYYSAVYQLVA